jgi:hypothetical protein
VLEKARRATQNYETDDSKKRVSELGKRREDYEDQLLAPLAGTTKCHLFFTAHEANVFGADNKVVDVKPDATRNIDHYFDLVVRLYLENGVRKAKVYKSAFLHIWKVGDIIDWPTWDNLIVPLTRARRAPSATQPAAAARTTSDAQRDSAGSAQATQAPVATAHEAATQPADAATPVYSLENPPRMPLLLQLYKQAGEPDGSFGKWCEAELIEATVRGDRKVLEAPALLKAHERLTKLIEQNDGLAA